MKQYLKTIIMILEPRVFFSIKHFDSPHGNVGAKCVSKEDIIRTMVLENGFGYCMGQS